MNEEVKTKETNYLCRFFHRPDNHLGNDKHKTLLYLYTEHLDHTRLLQSLRIDLTLS